MPTSGDLAKEAAYQAEIIPVELAYLARNLRNHWELAAGAIGIRGNERHLRGYHRSRRWIRESRWCTNRTYSVSENAGNQTGGNSNWISAIDITLPPSKLLPACQRLDIEVRAGRLEKVAEWYGNLNGDSRVDGYNNIANHPASSDDSHLWHLHISFVRSHANDNHEDLFRILTGQGWTPPAPSPEPNAPASLEWTEEMLRNLPELKLNDKGLHVYSAQGLLCARGFKTDIDGVFGKHTREQTIAMQTRYGAEHIDGIFGPETWTIAHYAQDLR